VQAILALAAVALAALYAGPKLVALNGVPAQMDRALAAADRYNPALEELVRREADTLANLEPLETIGASIEGILAALGGLRSSLGPLPARLRDDVAAAVRPSGPALDRLAGSLGELEARLRDLGGPLDRSADAVAQARVALAELIAKTASLADAAARIRAAAAAVAANVVPSGA